MRKVQNITIRRGLERIVVTQRTLAQARCVGTIVALGPWLTTEGHDRVRHSIVTQQQMYDGKLHPDMQVNVRVRHLLLDEGGVNERYVWDAYVVGAAW